MPDIEIKRGYEILPDSNIRFGIRIINNSDFAISDVEVILDYSESLFQLEGSKVKNLSTIPPSVSRTAKFILKPMGCIHKENISAIIIFKDHHWKKQTLEMRPKEVHCVCPFLKEKYIKRADFLAMSQSGFMEERGLNFEGISVNKLVDFLAHTCKNRLYKVDEFSIENGKILYLAGDAVGEKAYYILTAVVKEYEGLTQVLLRVNSDKIHGLNGFLNETLDNLRHLVVSTSAREIGIIKKEHVINIIDSVVQRSTISMEDGAPEIKIKDSMVHRVEAKGEEKKKKLEEERKQEKQLETKTQDVQRSIISRRDGTVPKTVALWEGRLSEERPGAEIKNKSRVHHVEAKEDQVYVQREPMAFNTGVSMSVGMGFVMVLVAYGITYILEINPYPIALHYMFFIFSLGLIGCSVYFEKERGAIYPWSLIGGALLSASLTLIITVSTGGLLYISESGIRIETIGYGVGICTIISFILLNFLRHKL